MTIASKPAHDTELTISSAPRIATASSISATGRSRADGRRDQPCAPRAAKRADHRADDAGDQPADRSAGRGADRGAAQRAADQPRAELLRHLAARRGGELVGDQFDEREHEKIHGVSR